LPLFLSLRAQGQLDGIQQGLIINRLSEIAECPAFLAKRCACKSSTYLSRSFFSGPTYQQAGAEGLISQTLLYPLV
jgi:hypothetical protein